MRQEKDGRVTSQEYVDRSCTQPPPAIRPSGEFHPRALPAIYTWPINGTPERWAAFYNRHGPARRLSNSPARLSNSCCLLGRARHQWPSLHSGLPRVLNLTPTPQCSRSWRWVNVRLCGEVHQRWSWRAWPRKCRRAQARLAGYPPAASPARRVAYPYVLIGLRHALPCDNHAVQDRSTEFTSPLPESDPAGADLAPSPAL